MLINDGLLTATPDVSLTAGFFCCFTDPQPLSRIAISFYPAEKAPHDYCDGKKCL